MNYKEQQETVERLRTNRKPLMDLTAWEQDLLRSNPSMVLRLVPSGQWHPMHCDKLDDGRVYCLKADLQLSAPAIEAPAGYRIVSMEDRKRCKFPLDCNIKYTACGKHGWVPPSYRKWRNDETDGLSRHYAVPSNYTFAEDRPKVRWFFNTDTMSVENGPMADLEKIDRMCSQHCTRIEIPAEQKAYLETKPEEQYEFKEFADYILNHFSKSEKDIKCLAKELKRKLIKDETGFVEYRIVPCEDGKYHICIKHLNIQTTLSELPSIVGFTGDILFRYSDGTEQWRYTLTDRSRDGTPATPIAARFYIKGETK